MTRAQIAIGGTFALIVAFFAGIRQLEGSRSAQLAVAIAYVVALVLLMRWANRRRVR